MRRLGASSGGVPSGTIQMWSGAISDIPDGYVLCDGTDGTPDLTDRFVVGSGGAKAQGETGGSDSSSVSGSVSDTSTVKQSGTDSVDSSGTDGMVFDDGYLYTEGGRDFVRRLDGSAVNSQSGKSVQADFSDTFQTSVETEPPYYAMAYIMKV